MNKKRVTIFAAVFAVLAIFSYVATKENKPKPKKSEFAIKDGGSISKFEVTKAGKVFEFVNDGKNWIMNQPEKFQADSQMINSLLQKLEKVEFKDVLTNSEKDYAKLNVDKNSGINIRVLSKSNESTEFIIGKHSSDFLSCYVRKGQNVYIIKDVLDYYFSFDTDTVKDKKIIDFDTANLNEFSIVRNKKAEHYVLKDNNWINSDNKQVNMQEFLDMIKNIRLVKFRKEEEIKQDLNVSNNLVKIDFKYKDGKNDTINISKIKRDNISAASTYHNIYFELTQPTVDSITSSTIKVVEPKATSSAVSKP